MKEDEIRNKILEALKKAGKTPAMPVFLDGLKDESKETEDLAGRTAALEKLADKLESRADKSDGVLFFGFLALLVVVATTLSNLAFEKRNTYLELLERVNALKVEQYERNTPSTAVIEKIEVLTKKISDLQWMISQQNKATQ